MTFTAVHEAPLTERGPLSYSVSFLCNGCHRGVNAIVIKPSQNYPTPLGYSQNILGSSFKVEDIRPLLIPPSAPAGTPEKAAEAFLDGMDNLNRKRWNPAGASFRRAIELGLLFFVRKLENESEPDLKRLNKLNLKIDWIAKKGWIAPALHEWSHAVRLIGNEIHDEDGVTEDEARDISVLCEALLTYLFSLPELISKRKAVSKGSSPTS